MVTPPNEIIRLLNFRKKVIGHGIYIMPYNTWTYIDIRGHDKGVLAYANIHNAVDGEKRFILYVDSPMLRKRIQTKNNLAYPEVITIFKGIRRLLCYIRQCAEILNVRVIEIQCPFGPLRKELRDQFIISGKARNIYEIVNTEGIGFKNMRMFYRYKGLGHYTSALIGDFSNEGKLTINIEHGIDTIKFKKIISGS